MDASRYGGTLMPAVPSEGVEEGVARRMVRELEEFLGAALSARGRLVGLWRWPLRYNARTGVVRGQSERA